MTNSFTIKRGDTARILEITIKFGTDPVDLTNVESALIFFKRGTSVVERDLEIDNDPTTGVVRYTFADADWTAVDPEVPDFSVGKYSMEVELSYAGGATLTSPSVGYASLTVEQDLGPVA